MLDVVVAGGGPAGLSAATRSAQRGFRTLLLERQEGIPDKACGEGLMPSGVREIERLGVRVGGDRCARFTGIRYLQEDGTVLEARFGEGRAGLGIRRTVLQEALRERALAAGASLERGTVQGFVSRPEAVEVQTSNGPIEARLLLAADGLHSSLRRAAGLGGEAPRGRLRFGIRRHFEVPPWSDLVEVHWAAQVEAYVTPVAPRMVNVALLRDRDTAEAFETLLDLFPRLRERIAGAPFASEARGAGPLLQPVRSIVAQRFALVGDAAGYVDAITGQGLSLAFAASAVLFESLPSDLGADLRPALRRYQARLRPLWFAYALPARALLSLSRQPALRRVAFRSLRALPGAFPTIVRLVA